MTRPLNPGDKNAQRGQMHRHSSGDDAYTVRRSKFVFGDFGDSQLQRFPRPRCDIRLNGNVSHAFAHLLRYLSPEIARDVKSC